MNRRWISLQVREISPSGLVPSSGGACSRRSRAVVTARKAWASRARDPAVPGVPAVSGLVHHEHGLLVRQMLQHVAAQVVAEQVGVPLCPPEQVLQPPVRGGVPDVLDYGPAVLARQVREQSKDQVLYPTPGFNPREAARDPLHQALERLLPPGTVYAVTCGHCMFFSLPTPMINGGRTRFHSALTADRARRTYATRRSLVGRVR